MKNNTHSVRQIVCSCISMLLTALLTVLTYLDPEQVPLAPLLVRMLLLPGLLLVIAGVNFCCLKTGICKLFTGKPDRHTTAVLTVLLAFVLCALGVFPDAAAAAALLLTASAWLDLLEHRLEAELPGMQAERTAENVWTWTGFAAAICASAVWAVLHARPAAILGRALCVLAASALCPLHMISLLTSRRAMQRMSIPTVSAKIIEALGTADTALLRPEGLLTGEPTAVDIRPTGMEAGQFLALAASVMQDCNAPEATAILNTAHSCGITVPSTGHCTQTPDGFCAELDGKRYYAGTSEQLRRRGIFAPRADDISLSGKTALLFGMEGGMYLGLIALQSPLLLGAPEACRVLAAQRLRLAIPAGSQSLYIRQLASQTNTEVIEAAGPEQALMQLAQRGRPICIRAGEPSTYLQEQIPILSVQTLADAEDPISVCRRAVHTRRSLQGFSAVCTFLLAGAAGGLFAPALDLGAKPAFCVLLACFLTGMTLLPVLTGKCKNAAAACIAENKLPQTISSESKPPEQETPSHTLTIRMEELPAMPGKAALEQALLAVPGVQTAEADYESGLILVTGTAEKNCSCELSRKRQKHKRNARPAAGLAFRLYDQIVSTLMRLVLPDVPVVLPPVMTTLSPGFRCIAFFAARSAL